jgi:DNA invertase Pin-like site-specific DNA recombinase
MPYKSEKPGQYIRPADDKRRKLTDAQREEIREQHAQGASQRQLAVHFGVSRRLVSFILDPEKEARQKQQFAERRKDGRYYDPQKHTEQIREHRRHKHKLYTEGKLATPPKDQ